VKYYPPTKEKQETPQIKAAIIWVGVRNTRDTRNRETQVGLRNKPPEIDSKKVHGETQETTETDI